MKRHLTKGGVNVADFLLVSSACDVEEGKEECKLARHDCIGLALPFRKQHCSVAVHRTSYSTFRRARVPCLHRGRYPNSCP